MLVEKRLGGDSFRIAQPDLEKPRTLTATEENRLSDKMRQLNQRADQRAETCWQFGCTQKCHVWVREVGFDFKGDNAHPLGHIAVSSSDYDGPVPGFCRTCRNGTGPVKLAETVYFNREEMRWGVRPNRWIVAFTDDTLEVGSCIMIDPLQLMPNMLMEDGS